MKKRWFAALAAFLLVCGAFVCAEVARADGIYDSVIRLHVIAASDSAEDQALKLTVRDAVLAAAAPALEDVRDVEAAEETLRDALDELQKAAEDTVAANGYTYPVRVVLAPEQYPRRTYEEVTLPAGEYLSLRVIIGEGAGQNWWCVLFPALCRTVAAAPDTEEECIEAGLTPDEYQTIAGGNTGRYRIRLRLLEWFSGWKIK